MNINPTSSDAYRLLHEGTLALARAEQQGIRIDINYVEEQRDKLTQKIDHLERDFKNTKLYHHWRHSIGNKEPNIYSNHQLAHFLYKVKKLVPPTNTFSGQGSTDEEALKALDIPELVELIRIRKLKKVRDTYLESFVKEQTHGMIHPIFNLHLVRTFRSSCDRPNFQNIPKRDKESKVICRKALFPREGHQFLEVDFGSLEVRISACYHKDPQMLRYITDPTTDMHADMGTQLYLLDKLDRNLPEHKYLRDATKNSFVFPQFYGDYYKNCAHNLVIRWGKLSEGRWKPGQGVPMPNGIHLADHFISKGIRHYEKYVEYVRRIEDDFWNNRFFKYSQWKERWWRNYLNRGYVDMLTGFRCSGLMSRNDTINYPVQGAAFHCLLWSFIELDQVIRKENWDTRIVGQIHDSVLLDVNPAELDVVSHTVKHITTEALPKAWPWIIVPLEVEMDLAEVDHSWADLKKFTFA